MTTREKALEDALRSAERILTTIYTAHQGKVPYQPNGILHQGNDWLAETLEEVRNTLALPAVPADMLTAEEVRDACAAIIADRLKIVLGHANAQWQAHEELTEAEKEIRALSLSRSADACRSCSHSAVYHRPYCAYPKNHLGDICNCDRMM